MQKPLQITFHNLDHSAVVEQSVRDRFAKLESLCDELIAGRVAIEAPHHSRTKGNSFHIAIELSLPGRELLVTRDPGEDGAHTDVYIALRDAFGAATRELKGYLGKRRDLKRSA